ncbi:MAG: RHS repeat-associated core domain-containing protein, partial [Acidobacteriota bacterium]
ERSVAGAATQTLHRHIHSRRPANSAGLRYIAFNAADNRLSGTGYDASGNLTTDLTGRSFAYDAENRQVSYNGGSVTVNASYDYDGEGRRVRRIQNGVTTVFVSNAQGQLAAEYWSQAAAGPGGTSYVMGDHLGSTRLVTKADGTVRGRHDYLPFGEEIGTSYGGRSAIAGYGAADLRQKFTAKERDSESNLDYFGARYHSGAQGRFTSVDPENRGAIANDPQTWNGYSYARNNPLLYTDPTGEAIRICDNNNENCANSEFDPDYFERTNPNLRFSNGVINAVNEDGSLTQVGTYAEFGDAVEPLVDLTDLFRTYSSIAKGIFRSVTRLGINEAKKNADSFVDLATPQRRKHILEGDATGGGHRPGTGFPGKSEFPFGWSDDKIMHHISDVATDPLSKTRPGRGGRTIVTGNREGVEIEVILEAPSKGGGIVTAYPANRPRNP